MTVIILFTYGISLVNWRDTGLLNRELKIYERLAAEYDLTFKLLTFGDKSDLNISISSKKIQIVPIYTFIKKSKFESINYIKSLFIGFKFKKLGIEKHSIIKTNQLWGAWVGIVLKLTSKSKLLVRTGYDLLTFKTLQQKAPYKIFIFKNFTRLALKYSDYYVVTSYRDKEYLQTLFPKYKMKLAVIKNYVEITPQSNLVNNEKIISVGRLEKQKNYEYLVKEMSNSSWTLDIVGEGTQKESLNKLIRIHKSNVNLIGTMSNTNLLKKLTEYKLYVSSTLYEGNPKSILEAMAAGCVVIAPKVTGVTEIIEHGVNGFLYELKEKELSELLNNINNYKLNEISKMAKKYILENHDIKIILQKEYALYSKL
ncbi:glycosyltransferase [Acidimicrobiia bacterium]|jgi:glycosyltransferase involved in cell wall biosynthesis|nr:glycosyltransferase [Acidimicrobiia bacterium]